MTVMLFVVSVWPGLVAPPPERLRTAVTRERSAGPWIPVA